MVEFLAPDRSGHGSRSCVSAVADFLESACVSDLDEDVSGRLSDLLQRTGRSFIPSAAVSDDLAIRPLAQVCISRRVGGLSRLFNASGSSRLALRGRSKNFCTAHDGTRNDPGVETYGRELRGRDPIHEAKGLSRSIRSFGPRRHQPILPLGHILSDPRFFIYARSFGAWEDDGRRDT